MGLNTRKARILQAIVVEHVETCEPIGSEWLASRYEFGCKPATLRNEMADMADQGYLVQPHTSAGRVPSAMGYRYYVDRLMPQDTSSQPEPHLGAMDDEFSDVDRLVARTCQILAETAQYPCVATAPGADSVEVKRVYLSLATSHHALLVVLFSTGRVEHRLLPMGSHVTEACLERVASGVSRAVEGVDLRQLAATERIDLVCDAPGDAAPAAQVFAALVSIAGALQTDRLFLEGTSHILRQREFQNVQLLEKLLSALSERSVLARVFAAGHSGTDVTVMIGPETEVDALCDCSVIASRYSIGDRPGGFLGIVGPTRMPYERAVALVGMMSRALSSVLRYASIV